MKRAVLIVNPYSTHVTGDRILAVEEALSESIEVDTTFTQHPGHATELAEEAAEYADAILVFSGDGTYNEALNGAHGAVPFGFLPGGGTSVVPRALGLPRDPVDAARIVGDALATDRTRRISLGRVNGRRFCFSAGVGFDAEAVRRLNLLGRGPGGVRPGDIAFVRTLMRMLVEQRSNWPPQLEIEGLGRAAFLFVANCDPYTYVGRVPLHIAPRASFEGGFDVVAPERVRPADVPRLLTYALRGGKRPRGVLEGHDLDRLEVHCDRPLPVQADGEDLGDAETLLFEAERDAISVLV